MKTWLQCPSPLVGTAMLAMFVPTHALAEFSGSDSLARESANWAELFPGSARKSMVFQNSRLESRSGHSGWAYLKWMPNKGTLDQDWFVQVRVHRRSEISLGVANAANRHQGYMISMVRGHEAPGIEDFDAFRACTFKGKAKEDSLSSADDAFLRIHYDSTKRTLTGSWKTRADWNLFPAFRIDEWNMDDSSRFNAVLIGGGYTYHDDDDDFPYHAPSISPGSQPPSYFKDFSCGTSSPNIDVEQPAYHDLKDGISKKSFGTAAVDGGKVVRIFTIRNNGTARLRNIATSRDGTDSADFHASEPLKKSLEPGETTTFTVTFRPKAAGTRRAAIHVTSNDPENSPFDFAVAGMGAM